MRTAILFFLIIIFQSVGAQQTIRLIDGTPLVVSVYWKTEGLLYFKTTSPDTAYTIPLSALSSYPSLTSELKSLNPDLYIMQFRRTQLTGIWLSFFGAAIASIGAVVSEDKVSPLVYGGIGICVIGFGFHLGSYSHLQKYFILKSAQPYIVKK